MPTRREPCWDVQEHQASPVRACNVLVREHQATGSRCESELTVSRVVSPSLFIKAQEAALTAPEGTEGSALFLLTRDEILRQIYGNNVQLIGLEAVASPPARRGVSIFLPVPLVSTLPDALGLACGKTEQGLQTL